MKKLNITKEHFEKSNYFNKKYGKLEYVSESGKVFKTNKGKILMFKESIKDIAPGIQDWGSTIYVEPLEVEMSWDDVYYIVKKDCRQYPLLEEELGLAPYEEPSDEQIREWIETNPKSFMDYLEEFGSYNATDFSGDDEYDESTKKFGKKFAKESSTDDGSAWFDERGELLKPLPGACVMACASQGRVDDDIDFWTRELGFDVGFPVEKAAKYLQEYGAWEDLDLLVDVANTGDKAKLTEWLKDNGNDEDIGRSTFDVKGFATRVLAHRVLWIFCNDLKELAYEMMDDETSLVSDWGDPSTWGDDEWERFQKEYSYCSLNN